MSDEEFAGVGLALGSVTGARSFRVDKLGRLTGVHYPQVWKPGENISECRKSADGGWRAAGSFAVPSWTTDSFLRYINTQAYYTFSGASTATPPPQIAATIDPKAAEMKKKDKPKRHEMSDCKCGFYGYYDGSDDYHQRGYVSAVVEGYGEALIGTRGFRVSKARIIALSIPAKVDDRLAALVRRNYAGIPTFTKFSLMVAEYPCDGGELAVTPDTDEDFWTRTA